MDFFRTMGIMVEFPWLALAPAVLFFVLSRLFKSRSNLIAALAWLAYAPYEFAMKWRILCAGECNIRIDLIAIYPALAALSAIAVVALTVRALKKRRDNTAA